MKSIFSMFAYWDRIHQFQDGVPFGVKIEDDYNGIKIDEF